MIELVAGAVAVVCAFWAGALALAEESPAVSRALADEPTGPTEPVPLHRALQTSRLALLFVAGAASGMGVGWWYQPTAQSLAVFAVSLGLLLMVGEVLPRFVAQLLPDSALAVTSWARRSLLPFRPLLGMTGALERGIQRLLPAPSLPGVALGPTERDMLLGAFSLADTTVEDIMTPRLDIEAVNWDAGWSDVVETLRRSDHSRLPVYRDSPDEIVGILYAKDLLPVIAGITDMPATWQDKIRPTDWVPETKAVESQLRDFQLSRGNIVVVVDEFGGTSGIVTLEDVMEEIVGEIQDEYDVHEQPAVESEGEDKFWFDGGVTLDEVSAATGAAIEHDDVSTIGGLVYLKLGRVPNPGEELEIGEFRVVVEQVVKRRIKKVYLERREGSQPGRVTESSP
ncbi:MAG: hemolysin family protein [Gemmatimonadales bacterium]